MMNKQDNWPMFGPDPSNTGHVERLGPKNGITEKWSFETENSVKSPPVIEGGTLYIGDDSWTDEQSFVYAIDTESREKIWEYKSGGVNHSLAVDGDSLIVGESFEPRDEDDFGVITSLDRFSGAVNWQIETDHVIYSAPTVVDGTVFIGSHDNNLYAIEVGTGDEKWRFRTSSDVVTSPTVTDGVVYIGSGRKDGHVYAVDIETGEQKWRFKTGEHEDFSSIDEGGVFNAMPAKEGVVYAGAHDGRLYALDAETGTEQWNFKAEGLIDSSPAVANGSIFFSSSDDHLYALDITDGSLIWQVDVPTSTDARPIVADETIYIGAGILRAFNTETGEELWNHKSIRGKVEPVLVDGTLYVGAGSVGAFE